MPWCFFAFGIVEECFDFGIEVEADHGEVWGLVVFFVDVFEVGDFAVTWATPVSAEVNDNPFSFMFGEVEGVT